MENEYDLPSSAPGQYMPLRADERLSRAYFPDSLPPELSPSHELATAVAEAMHALGRLDGLASEVDEPGAVFSSFVYKEAEGSSRVEGTAVTVSDLYRRDVAPDDRATAELSAHERDVREARNYVRALDEALDYFETAGWSRDSVTLPLIRDLHGTLLESGRSEADPRPGQFRSEPVAIEETDDLGQRQIRFVPPKPDTAERAMEDLERYVQSSHDWPDLVDVALIHYQFETVHPFVDGNGRIGRLLVVLLLATCGLLQYPILYPSAYFDRRKDAYTDRLLRVSEAGEWESWITFFLEGIREQATEAFVRARLLLDLRETYESRYTDAPPTVQRLARALFSDPYFSVPEAADALDVTYPTANDAVDHLQADGVLTEITGQEQYRVFRAEEVMATVERPAEGLPAVEDIGDRPSSWGVTGR